MEQNNEWLKNKIKGDLGEAICKAHFEAMGYVMTKIGIENILNANKLYGDKIKTHLQKLPDFLATKNKHSLLVESKYRKHIDFNKLKYELIWTYRNMIFTDEFITIIKSNLLSNEYDYNEDDFFRNNDEIMCSLLNEFDEKANEFSKLDIIFYITVREKKICYIYNSKFPNYLHEVDADYYKNNANNISDHQFENIQTTYENIIKPTLEEIF